MISPAPQSLALALGIGAVVTVACRRLRFPALLPLMGMGLLLGISRLGIVNADSLGDSLRAIITVAIGLLIFEGTLHLNRRELTQAPRAVWGLLTIGVVATMGGVAVAAHWILGFGWPISLLLGAIFIVTGPTVVQPILKVIKVSPRLNATLAAEAILIDAIGVIVTITTLEVLRGWLVTGEMPSLSEHGVTLFFKPMLAGLVLGLVFGVAGYASLKAASRREAESPMAGSQVMNLVAVGVSMTCVGAGEAVAPEAGLVAVTICGLIMAQAKVLGGTELRTFKELLATLLVGTLFILLASRFDTDKLRTITWKEGAFLAAVLLLVRPVSVNLAAWRSALTARERAFASFFAPRGVVALAVASIAATELEKIGIETHAAPHGEMVAAVVMEASRLDTIVFVVIVGSVLVATVFSPVLARVLRVRAGRGNAILVIGAHRLGIELGKALKELGIETRLVDNNASRVAEAAALGLDVISGDATDTRWLDDVASPHQAGWVIAWTGNDSVDLVVARWGDQKFGVKASAIWPQKEPTPDWSGYVVGWPLTRNQALAQVERGVLKMGMNETTEGFNVVLGWIDRGVLGLAVQGATAPKASAEVKFFGLLPNAPKATTVAPAAQTPGARDEFALQ